ncbi:MAG: efflux RND transporter periplasmic adaptor subunit [Cyclobacteriaceae bacterium]|nr:efflux RND transporter periplasmic adaptor subunit [Cyclobacteriaceae bacterium]
MQINSKILILLIFIGGCARRNQSSEAENETVKVDDIRVTNDQMSEMGLEVGYLEKADISEGVAVNGYLDTPPQYKANVSSMIGGRITNIHFLPGDYVQKGQEVVSMESPEFLRLQQHYIEARGELKYLENEYQRQKKLNESNVNAQKVYLQAERDYLSKSAEFTVIGNQLKLLDADPVNLQTEQLSSVISLRAPVNGYISAINAALGEYMHAEDKVFRMVNPEHLHAELNVFEKDILKIKKGQQVELGFPQMKDSVILGEVFLVGKELDEDSRSINVHVHITDHRQLVVGMYVEARILTHVQEVFVIPNEALILEEKGASIFMVTSQDEDVFRFKKVPVKVGAERDGRTQIFLTEDVKDDSRIAISGIYYLSSNE